MYRTISKLLTVIVLVVFNASCANMGKDNHVNSSGDSSRSVPDSYIEAISAAKDGDTKTAIKLFKKSIAINPSIENVHTNLGLQYLKLKNYSAAEDEFKIAIKYNDEDVVAYNHQAVVMRNNGKFDTAKEMYQKALKYKPEYANAHLNLGVLFDIYLNDLENALSHYKSYNKITESSDKLVLKWVVDLERRISAKSRK